MKMPVPHRRAVRPTGPIRVMHVVPELRVGGAERHATLVFPRLDPQQFTTTAVCIGQEGELFGDLVAAGVPARALGRGRREAIAALVELVAEMRRQRPDVVITNGYNAEILGRLAAVITRVPRQVVWVHNNGDIVPRSRSRRVTDRLLDKVTDRYFAVAHGQIPYITRDLGLPMEKIRVIHNGVRISDHPFDPDARRDPVLAQELGIGIDDPVLGIVAVLRPEKDHETFLAAARLILDQLPSARFLVVGGGPRLEGLRARARELGIAERVIFTGARSDVPALLRQIDVFSLTSYTVEAFPTALLEAMASGRAAVCTAVGGIPEMIDDGVTGYTVPPRDPQAFAQAALKLLGDRAMAHSMGIAARDRLEREFTLERSVQKAELGLAEVAGRRPVAPELLPA